MSENMEAILLFLAVSTPLWGGCFVAAIYFRRKMIPRDRMLLVRAAIVDVEKVRIKHQTSYFMVYQYEYMGQIYRKISTTPAAVANYEGALEKVGTQVELYIDPADPEDYFSPEDKKMSKAVMIVCLCFGIGILLLPFIVILLLG